MKRAYSMKRRSENKNYEPIYGSDIFNQLPSKHKKAKDAYDNSKTYDLSYEGFKEQEYLYTPKSYLIKSNKYSIFNNDENDNNFNPFKTTYRSFYKPIYIRQNNIVSINKDIGTGIAYNSRKRKIDFLKSNIFCDEDKYKQNKGLIDNFDPKLINHNNWYNNLDWRYNKSELIFYKQNQKEFYDNNSSENKNSFKSYKQIYDLFIKLIAFLFANYIYELCLQKNKSQIYILKLRKKINKKFNFNIYWIF